MKKAFMTVYRVLLFVIACYMVYSGGLIWIWLLLPAFIGWTKGWQDGVVEVKRSGIRGKIAHISTVIFFVAVIVLAIVFRAK